MGRSLTSGLLAGSLLLAGVSMAGLPAQAATSEFTRVDTTHLVNFLAAHGGELFATGDTDSVWVYDASNIAAGPVRTITGDSTGLREASGVAVDARNGELFVADWTGKVLVFPLTANGNAAPLRVLAGANTQLRNASGIALHGDTVFVTTALGTDAILAFPRTASGDVSPLRRIAGSSFSQLADVYGPAVDPIRREILVANYASNTITAYPLTANGDAAPTWTLNTGAGSGPDALAMDFTRGTLMVSLFDSKQLAIYSLGARNTDQPTSTIASLGARLYGSAFDPTTGRFFQGTYENFLYTATFTARPTWNPTNVTATVTGPGAAEVSWTRPANQMWAPVTGYTAVASPGGASCSVRAGASSCTIRNLAPGRYRFVVTATNGAGGAASSDSSREVLVATSPSRSGIKAIQCVQGRSAVTFADPESTGGARITAFEYRYRVGARGPFTTGTSPRATVTLPALTKGAYQVSVAARNAAGLTGEFSAVREIPSCR